jgi:hypothetical protein
MSDQRRPTARFGRRANKDPRVDDSVPPTREPEKIDRRSDRPSPRTRRTAPDLPVVAVPASIRNKDPLGRIADLESELARERAERAAEADLLGQILARATQAEARVKILEQTLARVNEERTLAEAQLQAVRAEIDALLADRKAAYTAQTSSLEPTRGSDSRPQLRAMRALANELLQSLDTVLAASATRPPPSKPPSKPPSSRGQGSDRPAKRPTLRPRAGR